ncbi:hypothetical protein RFI_21840 [Reticulomyxa filosa]|uniref:Uncharacterized protein n=1 Tax=Reticulomyxa filosa TaxID=46433 RepID=X6MNV0_RETFI|nr:hypothetical protein RFI_21840 [Reticulomyxa filosa]|eukprot:ETO15524.1 hypothetical protein RFI_21840 [Reticulomyxa filosa]
MFQFIRENATITKILIKFLWHKKVPISSMNAMKTKDMPSVNDSKKEDDAKVSFVLEKAVPRRQVNRQKRYESLKSTMTTKKAKAILQIQSPPVVPLTGPIGQGLPRQVFTALLLGFCSKCFRHMSSDEYFDGVMECNEEIMVALTSQMTSVMSRWGGTVWLNKAYELQGYVPNIKATASISSRTFQLILTSFAIPDFPQRLQLWKVLDGQFSSLIEPRNIILTLTKALNEIMHAKEYQKIVIASLIIEKFRHNRYGHEIWKPSDSTTLLRLLAPKPSRAEENKLKIMDESIGSVSIAHEKYICAPHVLKQIHQKGIDLGFSGFFVYIPMSPCMQHLFNYGINTKNPLLEINDENVVFDMLQEKLQLESRKEDQKAVVNN